VAVAESPSFVGILSSFEATRARIKALLRRSAGEAEEAQFNCPADTLE
jgi:xanthine/CO dehydrogenase XdhC/CoxF family maturation factor